MMSINTKNKILLVASPSSFTDQLKKAFRENNVELLYINDRSNKLASKFFRDNKLIWKFIRRFSFLKRRNNMKLGEEIINLSKKERPDLVFISKGMSVKADTLLSLRDMNIKTANWFPENTDNYPYSKWLKDIAGYYDFLFHFDSAIINKFKNYFTNTKLVHLPFAVDPDEYNFGSIREEDQKNYTHNICFIGAPYKDRQDLLESVKDLGLVIYGWKGWEDTPLKEFYKGPLSAKYSAKVYYFSKICVNTNIQPPIGGVNFKTFEIPASKGFQLTDYREDINKVFENGKEVVVFKNKKEFREKVIYYLNNEEERKKIALDGYNRLINEHTMNKRIELILNLLKQ